MVKRRRTGTRSWARGIFAFFWIVLAGASGLYLFTLFTDPAALGSQRVQLSAVTGDEMATGTSPAAKPTAPVPAASGAVSSEVTELKGTIQALTQQVAALDARLKPIEKFIGPVAALPPATSVTTSPPRPPAQVEAAPTAAAEPAQEPQADAEDVTTEGNAVEAEPMPPVPAPAPRAELKPEPQAPAPAAEATPAPEAAEPPAVAVAPMEDDQGEAKNNAAANAPETPASPTKEVSIAAYDPVELPPAANDGSTRFGIEIGTVGKRDELRPLWREFLTKHAALVAGLQPRCVLAPDKKWRLVAGPFANAQDAEGACTLFKKADRPCSATVFAGDAL
jgi:hypothetical protein